MDIEEVNALNLYPMSWPEDNKFNTTLSDECIAKFAIDNRSNVTALHFPDMTNECRLQPLMNRLDKEDFIFTEAELDHKKDVKRKEKESALKELFQLLRDEEKAPFQKRMKSEEPDL